MAEGEAVKSAGAELSSKNIFIDTAELNEALQEDKISFDSPENVATENSKPPPVQLSNVLPHGDPPDQVNTTSESVDEPPSFRVQFTPSTTAEEEGCCEENGSKGGLSSLPQQLSTEETLSSGLEEEETDRTNVEESSGVQDDTGVGSREDGVLDQITSSGCVERESEQQQVPNQLVSASNTGSKSEHQQTSSQTVDSTRSEAEHNIHQSNILNNKTIEESGNQTSIQVSATGVVSESESHPIISQTLSPTPSPSSNIRDTSSGRPTMSSPIATPTAMPTRGGATSLEPQSPTADLGVSPYVMVKREGAKGLLEVTQFESPGLLYAKSTKERHNLDMLRPPDEVAEDVLDMIEDDPGHQLSWMEEEEGEQRQGEVDGEWEGEGGGRETSKKQFLRSNSSKGYPKALPLHLTSDPLNSLESPDERRDRPLSPLDPKVLIDLEQQAKQVASSLDYIMENLHNSLHAMTVCAKQSVMLHTEAVDNLHSVVDANVKATYSFLAKFEELKRQTVPLHTLSQQIKDINKILKVLENFRTP